MDFLCTYKEEFLSLACTRSGVIDPVYCLVQLYEDNAFHICKFFDEVLYCSNLYYYFFYNV